MSQRLIESLQNPALYDHPVDQFELLETHISWVILTGRYAYKIKKPHNFGFLDFSTLEKRHHYCQEELRLNRRLAPDLYLELIPIGGSETAPELDVAAQDAFEFAIKMVQFPQSELAEALLKRGEFTTQSFAEIAEAVAGFHQKIAVADEQTEWGRAETVMAPVQQNFNQIRSLLNERDDLDQLAFLESWAQDSYQRLQELLTMRKQAGYIRECHGDLHLGNITRFNGKITLFDCIEFNESFRWIDCLNDAAFLVMDLEHRQLRHFANAFINRYLELTGDYRGMALMGFYKSYRALVRAKVTLFSLFGDQVTDQQRTQAFEQYRSYADLAESYTQVKVPKLVLMHGYSGSGKSWLSSRILEITGAIRLRSDVERKRLFDPNSKTLYSLETSQQTFDHLQSLTRDLLQSGYDVIVDATFLKQRDRAPFIHLAEILGIPYFILCCQADDQLIRQRLNQRQQDHRDISDADVEVYELQRAAGSNFNDQELPFCIQIDTSQQQQVEALLQKLSHE